MLSVRLNATTSGVILVLVPVLFVILFLAIVSGLLFQAKQDFDRVAEAENILLEMQTTVFSIGESIGVLGSTSRMVRAKQIEEMDRHVANLKKQRERLISRPCPPEFNKVRNSTIELIEKVIDYGERSRKLFADPTIGGGARSEMMRPEGLSILAEMQDLGAAVTDSTTLIESRDDQEQFRYYLILLSAGLIMSCLVSVNSSRLFTSGLVRDIEHVSKNAHLIALGQKLPPPLAGETEITSLDRVLHEANDLLLSERRKELSILDNAADIICSLDEKLRFVAVGQTVEKIWGFNPEDLIGGSMLTLLADSNPDTTIALFKRISTVEKQGEIETVIRCKDKSKKTVIWNVSWSEAEQTFVSVVHDVTQLREIQQLKQRFIAMSGHDLRNPLMSIGVAIETLMEGVWGEVPEHARKELVSIEEDLSQLLLLINDLLDFERLEAGKTALRADCLSAHDICTSAMESLASIASMKRVKLIAPTGDAAILGDEHQLRQAVAKLLSISVKMSTDEDAVLLSIDRRPDHLVRIGIADNRSNMSDTELQAYFDRFSLGTQGKSVESIDDPDERATALSLALVKAIATTHGGHAGIDNCGENKVLTWISVPAFPEAASVRRAPDSRGKDREGEA